MTENLFFDGAKKLCVFPLGTASSGQDGAIFQDLFFHFNAKGFCKVHDLASMQEVGSFTLDKIDLLMPHSNAVFFGRKFYSPKDKFPILYTNIYNNYAKSPDRKPGVLCAYRITQTEAGFSSQLVQVLQIGFTEDCRLWCSEGSVDIRPYGNFTLDPATGSLHAFVMRDLTNTTRFFRFAMPPVTAGEPDETLGVPVKILQEQDILQQFDECYVNFMQGATCYQRYLYSVEGFTYPSTHSSAIPALRIFDTVQEKQVFYADLTQLGLLQEPECIEVYQDKLYYMDSAGRLFQFCFED